MASSAGPSTSSSAPSDATAAISQTDPGRRLHRKQEYGRGLACTACRSRKQKCDRNRPACSSCTLTYENCFYATRKQKATVPELEDVVRRLEHKYATRLLKSKKMRIRSMQQSTSHPLESSTSITTAADEDVFSVASIGSLQSPTSDSSQMQLPETASLLVDAASSGGHTIGCIFTESFLTMPTSIPPIKVETHSEDYYDLQGTSGSLVVTGGGQPSPSPVLITTTPRRHPISPTLIGSPQSTKEESSVVGVFNSSCEIQEVQAWSSRTSFGGIPFDMAYNATPESHTPLVALADHEQTEGTPISTPHTQLSPHTSYAFNIGQEPSLDFSRATWWDYLLQTYTFRPPYPDSIVIVRNYQDPAREISQDVRRFFHVATIYLHFINVPLFFDMFHHKELRTSIQPAFILSILAYSKLMEHYLHVNGSGQDDEEGERLWIQSISLRDLAQSAFDASYNAGWVDLPLAQAAWILLLYEISGHRLSSSARKESALILLDNILHTLHLPSIDAADTRAPRFAAQAVPALGRPAPNGAPQSGPAGPSTASIQDMATAFYGSPCPRPMPLPTEPPPIYRYQVSTPPVPFDLYVDGSVQALRIPPRYPVASRSAAGCPCHGLSLARYPETARSTPVWSTMPGWGNNPTPAEVWKEEARRLVWSSVTMSTADAAARLANGEQQLDLYIARPENFALLYAGEEVHSSLPETDADYSAKESIWALLSRAVLLFWTCVKQIPRMRPASLSDNDDSAHIQGPGSFETKAWMELIALEEALDSHTCNIEQSTLYQARDFILTSRLIISGGYRQSLPPAPRGATFARIDYGNATRWLQRQAGIRGKVYGVTSSTNDNPLRVFMVSRPFLTAWAVSQMWRCVELWKLETSLTLAVDVAITDYIANSEDQNGALPVSHAGRGSDSNTSTAAPSRTDPSSHETPLVESILQPMDSRSSPTTAEDTPFHVVLSRTRKPLNSDWGWPVPFEEFAAAHNVSTTAQFGGYNFSESFLTLSNLVTLENKDLYEEQSASPHASRSRELPGRNRSRRSIPSQRSSRSMTAPESALSSKGQLLVHNHDTPTTLNENAQELLEGEIPSAFAYQTQLVDENLIVKSSSSSFPSPKTLLDDDKNQESASMEYQSRLVHQIYCNSHYVDIAREPSLDFPRATWWDCLLHTYTIRSCLSGAVVSRSPHDSVQEISQDVYRFFKVACMYLHFIHAPLFFDMFHHTELRASIQPAFILGILAYAKLTELNLHVMRGGGDGNGGWNDQEGERMWNQSITLKDLSQAAFEASYNAGWIDLYLAEAAWILLLYEVSAHKDSSPTRKKAAFVLLDNTIRTLGLTTLDATNTRTPTLATHSVPTTVSDDLSPLKRPAMLTPSEPHNMPTPCSGPSKIQPERLSAYRYQVSNPPAPFDMYVDGSVQALKGPPKHPVTSASQVECPCHALSLARSPESSRSAPVWSTMPGWGSSPSRADILKEEARRLVWSSVVLLSVDATTRLGNGEQQLDLHISKPENAKTDIRQYQK
ncbi:hypothetical protein FRB96_008216 [Tulasnella sp. 330]|nr:hypothetical protein FRB96_008216 [Tulasnella sp. 330]